MHHEDVTEHQQTEKSSISETEFWLSDIIAAQDGIDFQFPSQTDELFTTCGSLDMTLPFEQVPDTPAEVDMTQALRGTIRMPPLEAPYRRTLPRRRSKYVLRRSGSSSKPMAIPNNRHEKVQPLAMQRWQDSPPENEAALLSDIRSAMINTQGPQSNGARSLDEIDSHRGPSSTTSLESDLSSNSVHSINSTHSNGSRRRSRTSRPKKTSKGKEKKKKNEDADRIFKCTFCCDTFKHKYDWARHEKSLHLNMEEWICAPFGGAVVSRVTGRVHCSYCNALDPTHQHLDQHQHNNCHNGQSSPRTFRRKDHLVQHLRLVHGVETLPLIDDWKVEFPAVVSRCGFCDTSMRTWEQRTDHLAAHFKEGKTMKDWRGEHDFAPEVMARVTYAFPPYLLAHQADTLVPFSATNKDSLDHTSHLLQQLELADARLGTVQPQEDADAWQTVEPPEPADPGKADLRGFADVLSRHLSRFAREQILKGVIPTDEMFQAESRRVLYQDDDEWNQTVADSPEWMRDFRERSGFM